MLAALFRTTTSGVQSVIEDAFAWKNHFLLLSSIRYLFAKIEIHIWIRQDVLQVVIVPVHQYEKEKKVDRST